VAGGTGRQPVPVRSTACGAAVPGILSLAIGDREFGLSFRIELHDAEPAVDDRREDIVEVSFRPNSARVFLVAAAAERSWPLNLTQRNYRVRYCAVGMDTPWSYEDDETSGEERFVGQFEMEERHRAEERATRGSEIPPAYLVQFWPGRAAPDRIIRQTSRSASGWHRHASG
jgi:hypothetical protein